MKPIYSVEELLGREGTATLPPELAERVGTAGPLTLEFGVGRAVARLLPAGDHRPGRLAVTGDLIRLLRIPPGCPFRVRTGRRRLRLGPVVGILAGAGAAQLTPDRLRAVGNHLLAQRRQGGLFYAFARDGIDLEQGRVAGHWLVPGAAVHWEPAELPLPQVVFRRFGIALEDAATPLQLAGVQVFNERVFHKWEAHQWLCADPQVRAHLPETTALTGAGSVLAMLERHPVVFVKPFWGSPGARILRVRCTGGGFRVEEPGGADRPAATAAELEAALLGRLPSPGVVQQGLDLYRSGSRLVDFRVVVQKDGGGDWAVSGIVARCGSAEQFLSNMATGGFPLPVADGLALVFGREPAVLFRRQLELGALGVAVGRALDRSGLLLGDLGVDIAYDGQDHPWVIEANNRDPDHNIAWEAGLWPMFYRFRTAPVDYACHLAGFADTDQEGAP